MTTQTQELDALEFQVRREIALSSPLGYATYHDAKFLTPPHVKLMSETIRKLTAGELLKEDGTPYTKLMVSMPPRHGKSHLVTRATPAWFLTKYPDKRVIVTGYEADFAADFGADARRYIAAHPELGVELDPSTAAKNNWGLKDHDGGMKTAGAGGAITGKGAHLFVIDDPVKNSEDADSPTIREKHWNWWQGTVLTRQEPGAVMIIVMTRWHEDDLAGRLLEQEGDEWYQLVFPAIADHEEGSDDFGRLPGEALWPERYPIEKLQELRQGMTNRWWSALYQQKPSIDGGNIFKQETFRYFQTESTPEGLVYRYMTPNGTRKAVRDDAIWKFTTLDLAATEKTTSDWTVAGVWGVTPDRELLLLDVIRERMESAEHEAFVRRVGTKHKVRYHGVEKATYGLTLIQVCRRMGIPVLELSPDKDKVARSWPAAGFIENGQVYFKSGAPWLAEYELELQQFPYGTHDDMVDITSYAAAHLADRVRPSKKERPADPPPGTVNLDAIVKNRKEKLRRIRKDSAWF